MADTSPNALLASAKCYNCNSNASIGMLLELALLKLIADNIGGSGGGAADYINYSGPPVTDPPLLQNIVVDSDGMQWMYFQGAWH